MASSNGNFVWYDLMSTDAKAAEAFYRGGAAFALLGPHR